MTTRKKRGRKLGSGTVVEQLQKVSSLNRTGEVATLPSSDTAQDTPANTAEVTSQATTAPEAWRSDLTPSGDLLQNDNFYSFDDFAQSLLNPSANVWHSNPNAGSETEWSPYDHETTASILSHPVVPSNTPHDVPSPATETPGTSPQTLTFGSNDIVTRGVDLFFQHMYPTYPILIESQVRLWASGASRPEQSEACMLFALVAATLVHVDSWDDITHEQRMSTARSYITLCMETRLNETFTETPSFADVVCSLFVALAYFELRCRTASWVYVREAVTLALASGMNNAAANLSLSVEERIQRQRCYALLFVTERGASILDNFPVSIMSTPTLSEDLLPNEAPGTIFGLQRLCDLFSLLDLNIIRLWNEVPLSPGENYGYIEFAHLQERLRRPLDLQGISDIQRADILITQQWLRLVFWQAALRIGLVSGSSPDPAFTYEFPIEIASSLCSVVKSLPPVAIQVHGLGIFKKQFEIAYSLLDSLTLSSPARTSTYYETLRYLLFSLSASPTSQQIYVKTLEKKIGGEQKYRHVSDVQLLRMDGGRHSVQPSSTHLPQRTGH